MDNEPARGARVTARWAALWAVAGIAEGLISWAVTGIVGWLPWCALLGVVIASIFAFGRLVIHASAAKRWSRR